MTKKEFILEETKFNLTKILNDLIEKDFKFSMGISGLHIYKGPEGDEISCGSISFDAYFYMNIQTDTVDKRIQWELFQTIRPYISFKSYESFPNKK